MGSGSNGRRWAVVAAIAAAAVFVWTLLRGRRAPARPRARAAAPIVQPRAATSGPPPMPRPAAPAVTSSGDGGLGQPWQWASGLLLATAIALSWWLLHGGVSTLRAPAPQADRRAAVDTAVSVPGRATRLAVLATPARADRAQPPAPGAPVPAPTGVAAAPASSGASARPPGAGRPLEALPLRGMGYNPTYATADVAAPVRAERLGRDMRLMASVGVNMVLGWEPGVFDEQLLAAAQANEISVILPFDLKPDWDYGDPELRQDVMSRVADWVARYRDQPAIVMWGVGNEVTLEMSDAERRQFADFYVDLFERVRAIDPTRPVVLREAEDVMAPYLAVAFAKRQGIDLEPSPTETPIPVLLAEAAEDDTPTPEEASPTPDATPTPRPVIVAPEGFVYGVNFYTDRVGPALTDFPANTGLDAPLLVSEYAPAGMSRAQRPDGFQHMYGLILAAGPRVVGSAPYTWTTAGPEAVDAYFGLVDDEGRAVDATVGAIARMYGVEPPTWARTAGPPQEANGADLPRLLGEATLAGARLAEIDADQVVIGMEERAAAADEELGVGPEATDEGDQRVHEIARLIGWAGELSELRGGSSARLFPGMREALPLLRGMARWARHEQSAVDTARDFVAAVLRRDLGTLGAPG